MYKEAWMETEIYPLQALAMLQLLHTPSYCDNQNDNTYYIWFDSSAGTNAQDCVQHSGLAMFISRINLHQDNCCFCLCMYIAARNVGELQSSYLLTNMVQKICATQCISIQTHVFLFFIIMTFYDV